VIDVVDALKDALIAGLGERISGKQAKQEEEGKNSQRVGFGS